MDVQTHEHQCGQQTFGYSRECTLTGRATHCYHHCGPEGMDSPVYGDDHWFCSLACYKAHLLETPSYTHNTLLQTLHTRARTEFHMEGPVKAAPPRCALQMFGGPLPVADFLAVADNPAVEVVAHDGHDITESMVVELRRKQSDEEGFRQVFQTGTDTTRETSTTGGCLFDKLVTDIKGERKEKIEKSQGKSIFKAMNRRKRVSDNACK
jgi:hypothetical protein